jgi:hypothetical protein
LSRYIHFDAIDDINSLIRSLEFKWLPTQPFIPHLGILDSLVRVRDQVMGNMGKQKSETAKKTVTIRLSLEDHNRLSELTASTGISVNSFIRRTILAVHELATDELIEPKLPQFFAALRVSMEQKPSSRNFK